MDLALCYIPLINGKSIKPEARGLIKQTKKLANHVTAIVIHCGMKVSDMDLDCDEIYMIELNEDQWPVAANHIHAFQTFNKDRNNETIIFLDSPLYGEIASGLAYIFNKKMINKAMDMVVQQNQLSVKKEIYGGKACSNEIIDQGSLITFDPTYIPVSTKKKTNMPVLHIDYVGPCQVSSIQLVEQKQLNWDEVALTEASCVIGVGRGVHSAFNKDQFQQVEELARILHAPIGGSKVADELQITPREKRIGSSGVYIDQADIYIAIGISGSSQHLDGIKNVRHVVAINSDAAAPIFKRCELGIISPFEEVLPKLVDIIKEKSGVDNSEITSHHQAGV
ncbi:electron transfer flavoprotein subunit alpha/FixB family protein [Siminovitchia acidinfaciens]|uniref:Electron transfer flavoprotein subunit alpha/FixB family protein n=1 Tax=Siminovitchia acidinfaciens TaxID=2321395 RepID=A0A429Y753_9BACI|nr:FAD-binding protein [Siminovitchia acidinfaciens]RST77261.1 electron transfer flavoprotein subunit alpha/FixB family protein [Siminovitchia acidinfaciens]